ncbi:hypothetical protein HYH02_004071 [Chlamydomonas schloesseri]|uniref:SF4 helicase domain-containing protein n=1 Tax=Chlamydomonas schloesseri TaxID=2026947 RepID=A0A835WQG9_9CHLO|nr:hypothetical protein HYH02_004071 [Chlamydomonas schloesseri]|eukprot:KAG2451473.1 hypothetical protein HYH02_004071 [Chlamydomonas schloesseri]
MADARGSAAVARAGRRFGALLPHMTARGHVYGCGELNAGQACAAAAAAAAAAVTSVSSRGGGVGRGLKVGGRSVAVAAVTGGGTASAPQPQRSSLNNGSNVSSGNGHTQPYVLSEAEMERRLASLRAQLEEAGVDLPEEHVANRGSFLYRTCPVCGGGEGGHDVNTFSMILSEDCRFVWYKCFRENKCGVFDKVWAQGVARKLSRDDGESGARTEVLQAPARPELQPEAHEPLDADALAYFAARGVSAATLRAAGVYQARDVPHPTRPGLSLPRVVVYPYTLRGVVVNATFHDIHNYCLTAAARETGGEEAGEGEGGTRNGTDGEGDAGEGEAPALELEPMPPPDPALLASLPGLRWQVVGAQRYLWGLDDVAFAPQLRRHREQLAAARRPPMAKPRKAADAATAAGLGAGGPGAPGPGGAVASGGGGAAGAMGGLPGLEWLVGAPPPPPPQLLPAVELDPVAAAAAAAAWQPAVAADTHSTGHAAQLHPVGQADGGSSSTSGDEEAEDDGGQDREAMRDMADEVVELELAQGRTRRHFDDEDEAEAAEEMELEFGEEDEYEWEEEEGVEYEHIGWGDEEEEEAREGEEEEDGEADEDEYEDEEEEELTRPEAWPPGMTPQAASPPPLGEPQAYGPVAPSAAAGAGGGLANPLLATGVGAGAAVPGGGGGAAAGLLHPRYRDLVVVEDEVERLCLLEAGVPNVLSLPPRAVVAFHEYTEALREAEAADEAAAAAAGEAAAGRGGRRRRGRGTSAAAAAAVGMSDAVLSYMFNSREVLSPEPGVVGGEVRVTLALKEDSASRMLAEELANGLVRERCLVLRWPATQLELPPLSRELLQHQAAAAQAAQAAAAGAGGWAAVAHEIYEEVPEYLRAEEDEYEEARELWQAEPMAAQAAAPWTGEHQQQQPHQQPYQQHSSVPYSGPASGAGAGGALVPGAPWVQQPQPLAVQAEPGPEPAPGLGLGPEGGEGGEAGGPIRACAGDVLRRDGPEALTWLVEQGARPYPVRGLMDVGGLWDEIIRHWYGKEATAAAVSTGWPGLDEVYRVTPGELTIVTGVPNSGKSHWLDALAVQLASAHEWRVGFASFEKSVVKHGQNLIELAARTSMFTPDGRQHMSQEQFRTALDWVNDHFFLIRHPDMADEGSAAPTPEQLRLAEGLRLGPGLGAGLGAGGLGAQGQPTPEELEAAERAAAWLEESRQPCTIDWVLGKATQAVYRHGIRGLVIDPYNELEQQRGAQSETEYISAMLSKVKRWAQRHMVHVWLVAHPKSFEEWDGSPPSMYDISGSAHWYNKADMGVVVHRYTRVALDAALKKYAVAAGGSAELQGRLERLRRKPVALSFSENETLIKVVKARNKTSGAQGDYVLTYSKERCRFLDPNFPDA